MGTTDEFFQGFVARVVSFSKVTAGRGFVGKTTHLACIAFIVVGTIVWGISNEWVRAASVIGILSTLIWLINRLFIFAKENPMLALMEGAEIVAFHQAELTAKGLPAPPGIASIMEDPKNPRPAIESEEADRPDM